MHSISADIFYTSSVANIFPPPSATATTTSYVRDSILRVSLAAIHHLELGNLR